MWKLHKLTTYIREYLFLTTNELLFINNHLFEKLLETPHIKATLKTLSLLLSSLSSLSLLCCSHPICYLFSLFLGAVATPDVVLYRRKSRRARTTSRNQRLHEPRPGCTNHDQAARTRSGEDEPATGDGNRPVVDVRRLGARDPRRRLDLQNKRETKNLNLI